MTTAQPYNREAERCLIGALILDPQRIPEVADRLQASDLFDPALQAVFRALVTLTNRLQPVEYVTLATELDSKGHLTTVGGHEALVQLTQEARHTAFLAHHVEICHQASRQRRWLHLAMGAVQSLMEAAPGSNSALELMASLEAQAVKLNLDVTKEAERTDEIAPRVARRLLQDPAPGEFDGLRTGLTEVDRVLLGLQPGDLVILAARPGMGKTAFVLNLLRHALSTETPGNGLLASCEMGREAIVRRMVCEHAGVSANEIRRIGAFGTARDRIHEAEAFVSALPLTIDDQPAQSLMHLRSQALREKRKRGLSIIAVDYLQLMRHPQAENRLQEVSEISRGLKNLARELEVPVVALSQLSRRVEQTEQKRPSLSDLRESGSIEQDADQVIFLYRPSYYEKEPTDASLCEVIISKNRNGPTGFVNVNFEPALMRFSDRTLVERTVL